MAKTTIKTPNILMIDFRQEKGDRDYGSCLWAVFNFDLERYDLSIMSDCGNYAYGWVPTPSSESFMHLMARLDEGYLLDKLSSPTIIDEKATFAEVKSLMEFYGCVPDEDDLLDLEVVERACDQNDERDIVAALKSAFENTGMEDCDEYDLWNCIQKDFPCNAKKIAQVFMTYIQPVCKTLRDKEV